MPADFEQQLVWQCRVAGLPPPTTEFRFAAPRRWRFDLAWEGRKVAAEVEGAIWTRGRHTRGAGYEKDLEKYNTAAMLGWTVLRFSTGQVTSGHALAVLEKALTAQSRQ